jgi:wobble nucleotide-excising tRNase
MNDRIQKLAEQATTYIEPTSNSGEGWIFDKEKFAELLEKEFEAKHFSAGYIQGRSDGIMETVLECIDIALATKAEQLELVSDTKAFDSMPEGAKDHSFGRVVAVNQVVADIKERFGVE